MPGRARVTIVPLTRSEADKGSMRPSTSPRNRKNGVLVIPRAEARQVAERAIEFGKRERAFLETLAARPSLSFPDEMGGNGNSAPVAGRHKPHAAIRT
jgi:hypothetical protein